MIKLSKILLFSFICLTAFSTPSFAEEKKEDSKEKKDSKKESSKDKDGKGKRIERPSRNKALLISWGIAAPIFLILLAVLFYILAAKGKLPEQLKAPGEKYTAFVNSLLKIKGNAPEAQGAAETAAAKETPKARTPAPQVTVLPPPPKPVPVTRKEFISGVEKLLADYRNNPDKGMAFLNSADEFMAKFLPTVTKEEQEALNSLRIAYGPADELLRVNPARLKAQKAIENRLEADDTFHSIRRGAHRGTHSRAWSDGIPCRTRRPAARQASSFRKHGYPSGYAGCGAGRVRSIPRSRR